MTVHEQFVDLWDRQKDRRGQPAQLQAQPQPWEGISQVAQSLGINLGELWRTREEELKGAREAADATSRELHELRLREIDTRVQQLQAIADKAQQSVQPAQGQRGFLDKLDEITSGLVSQRIASLFGQDPGKQPVDPIEEFFHRLDQVEEVKQRFGNPGGGGAQALAQSGIRGELLKLLLEDERERLKMQYEHETQAERNKHLGALASTVKENLGDGISALKAAASEIKGGAKASASEQPQLYECGQCHTKFGVPPGDWPKVACPSCHTEYTREEVLGS